MNLILVKNTITCITFVNETYIYIYIYIGRSANRERCQIKVDAQRFEERTHASSVDITNFSQSRDIFDRYSRFLSIAIKQYGDFIYA